MLFKRKNVKCIAGDSENNCNLIAKLKSLQNEYELLEKENRKIQMKYANQGWSYCYSYFLEAVSDIRRLQSKNPNVIEDIMISVDFEKEKSKLDEEIDKVKRQLGIK